MKRLLTAPVGVVEVELVGSRDYQFVTVTRFDADGWSVAESSWGSAQDRSLGQFLAEETGFSDAEAAHHAADLSAAYRERGGYEEGSAVARKFTAGVLVTVAAVAVLALC